MAVKTRVRIKKVKTKTYETPGTPVNGLYGYVVISNCPRCQGAIYRYNSYRGRNNWEERHLFQCFQCSRIYIKKGDSFEIWAKQVRLCPEDDPGSKV